MILVLYLWSCSENISDSSLVELHFQGMLSIIDDLDQVDEEVWHRDANQHESNSVPCLRIDGKDCNDCVILQQASKA